MAIYDIQGNNLILDDIYADFADTFSIYSARNTITNTNYLIVRVFKIKNNGTAQYPFLYAPNGVNRSNKSTLQICEEKKFPFALNGGIFDMTTRKPIGTLIQNGIVLQQGDGAYREDTHDRLVLTIDSNGDLGWAEPGASASDMVSNGIVSAVLAFVPLIINYEDASETVESTYYTNAVDAQRQVFGQFGNGDYCVITAEGRGNEASTGFTIPKLIELCEELGLRFAFLMDGGGSTETVLYKKQLNPIYEGTYGREVPNYIIFNGTDTFPVV